jgi:hypothetical protein
MRRVVIRDTYFQIPNKYCQVPKDLVAKLDDNEYGTVGFVSFDSAWIPFVGCTVPPEDQHIVASLEQMKE